MNFFDNCHFCLLCLSTFKLRRVNAKVNSRSALYNNYTIITIIFPAHYTNLVFAVVAFVYRYNIDTTIITHTNIVIRVTAIVIASDNAVDFAKHAQICHSSSEPEILTSRLLPLIHTSHVLHLCTRQMYDEPHTPVQHFAFGTQRVITNVQICYTMCVVIATTDVHDVYGSIVECTMRLGAPLGAQRHDTRPRHLTSRT